MANDETIDVQIKSKKPSDSAFKQQRLPAWQPVLTAGTVLPAFFIIGIAFIPVGVSLLYFSDKVSEFVLDYTDCNRSLTKTACSSYIKQITDPELKGCTCEINFTLPEDFNGKVFMYYGLTNYYQNHRRYVKSRDDDQLLGRLSDTPSSDCSPFNIDPDNKLPIAPCGAIANSLFNDTLSIESRLYGKINLLNTGIAWPSDKKVKFRNPDGNLTQALQGKFAKPIAWTKQLWDLDPENPSNNGFQNEDLIVWMRTAALPSFRKLYRILDQSSSVDPHLQSGLPKGDYVLKVNYNYPVTEFHGTKRMILSTTSLLGGKNPFLGIAYIVVGCICVLLGVVLLFIHIKCSKSTAEMINVNPRTPYS